MDTLASRTIQALKAFIVDNQLENGHKLENRSASEAIVLEVGTRTPAGDGADYPDIDMVLPVGGDRYHHRDGTPYPKHDRRT